MTRIPNTRKPTTFRDGRLQDTAIRTRSRMDPDPPFRSIYLFERTFEQVNQSPFLGLHTLITSRHPKPIYWNHFAVSSLASCQE
ncbi:hypothetical protein GGR51DRAFT_148606 [Nemania sp. FL0031]|nr:hypothetical protein GGR51DRAFT_148606 [Nemania sp. FL0031]